MENEIIRVELNNKSNDFIEMITSATIVTDVDYSEAEEVARSVKKLQAEITDYWEPLRKSTYEAYSKVNSSKKQMLDPLKEAEKLIKNKMSAYLIEKKKKEEEEAELERQRCLEEARAQREFAMSLDGIDSDMALFEAEMLESQAETVGSSTKPKNAVKTWKIKSVDSSKVPVSFNDVEIRPVDESAVLELIKKSNGNISIPGIEFEEDYIIRISK